MTSLTGATLHQRARARITSAVGSGSSSPPRSASNNRRRRRLAKVVLVGALVTQALLLVRGGDDPHKLFGFRPFNESDTWRAEIVRVEADGARRPIDDGTWAYDWDDLVGVRKLRAPGRLRHAAAGAPATIDFLHRSLDWAIDHIPDDPDTVALEATVTVYRNGRGPEVLVLRSADRTGDEP